MIRRSRNTTVHARDRIGITAANNKKKEGAAAASLTQVLGTLTRQLPCAPVCPTRRNGQDITRTDNHYTVLNNLREEAPKFMLRYKELFTSL